MPIPDLTAFLPAGMVARPVRYAEGSGGADTATPDPADLEATLALVRACEQRVLGEADSTADEVAEMFLGPTTDRGATQLVHAGDRLVGFVWVENDPTAGESWIDIYAEPHDTDLVSGLIEFGRAVAAAHRVAAPETETEWSLRSGCFGTDTPLVRSFEEAGFERVRRFWRMRIELITDDPTEDQPPLPPGVAVIDAHAEPERRTAYDVQTTSFVDHWNNVARSYDEWLDYLVSVHDDPAGWWVLTVDGAPAAVCLLDDSRMEVLEGYVRALGVLREFRGRGYAELLLRRAFDYYRGRGCVAVVLGVDSESPTGANHLYEKVGMRPHRVIDAWSLPVH